MHSESDGDGNWSIPFSRGILPYPPMDDNLYLPTLGHKDCLDIPGTGSSLQIIMENLLPENRR